MHAVQLDVRLAAVPPERWALAQVAVERGWLRDVQANAGSVSCAFSATGIMNLQVSADLATLATRCTCADAQPCEHALALLLVTEPPAPPPVVAAPLPPPPAFVVAQDAADPGRVTLHGPLSSECVEALRWVWWRDEPDGGRSGEAGTLAQALQLLHDRGVVAGAAPTSDAFRGAAALFRQRALGEPTALRLLDPGAPSSLALAKLLADRGARPLPGRPPVELWTLDSGSSFTAWWLAATAGGADVRHDPALEPRPFSGLEVTLDVGCLPARALDEPRLREALGRLLRSEPARDEEHGHVLIPSARIADVEDALRAMGADITYKRLAPKGERFLEWPSELPEDLHGARPRLREPFHATLDEEPPGLKEGVKLEGYQREAVAFIRHHEHTCLLADDMGLGKTLECIASAQFVEGRVLVVCPASAREVWKREVSKFTGESTVVLGPGDDASLADAPAKYVVTGYSNLEHVAEKLKPDAFALVILDESHYVKNAGTGRAKQVATYLQRIPRRLVVSGTPVMNTPEEIRAQLAFLHPEEWSDASWFKARFEDPFEDGSPDVKEQVLARLRQFLEGVMIRREKKEALPDLPEKRIEWHRVPLPPEARRAYVALEDEFAAAFQEDASAAAGKLERLKQAALSGKMPEAIRFVRSRLDAGDKVVIFSRYRDALSSLDEELKDAGVVGITGDSSPEDRADAERRFQEDPTCRVFLGQLVAAGTALTLTAGTHVIFLDLSWNPADHRQAMDRIHRRGQTKPVTAHFFLALETVDEDVAAVLDQKGRMMDALLAPTGQAGAVRGAPRLVGARVLARRGTPVQGPLPR